MQNRKFNHTGKSMRSRSRIEPSIDDSREGQGTSEDLFAGLADDNRQDAPEDKEGPGISPELDDKIFENRVSLTNVIEGTTMEDRIAENRKAMNSIADAQGSEVPEEQDTGDELPDINDTTHPKDEVPNMPGAILRHAREMLGLSQRDIALRLKLRINTISDIEHDRLNAPTAAPFTRGHLTRYAKLVNIDPKVVLDVYDQNVDQVRERNAKEPEVMVQKPKDKSRYLIMAALMIVVLGVVFYVNTDKTVAEKSEGTLMASNMNAAEEEAELSAEAYEEEAAQETGSISTITIDTKAGKVNRKEDPNTLLAREQASAFGTNNLEGRLKDRPQSQGSTSQVALQLDKNKAESSPAQGAQAPAAAQAQAGQQGAQEPAAAEAAQGAEQAAQEVSLASKLSDLSSKVSLSGRRGLASMNEVSIKVTGAVALRITDSRNKVLKSGKYKAGDIVRVQGIPPIKVATSDTALISVTYMGGQLRTPRQKQASFVLPTR